MTSNDGGPAFPEQRTAPSGLGGIVRVEVNHGMTLRDYFAGCALKGGFMAAKDAVETAAYAYAVADALLEVRERPL